MENLIELKHEELEKTNGGDFGLTIGIVALAITILSTDWDAVGDSLSRGYNDGRNS